MDSHIIATENFSKLGEVWLKPLAINYLSIHPWIPKSMPYLVTDHYTREPVMNMSAKNQDRFVFSPYLWEEAQIFTEATMFTH